MASNHVATIAAPASNIQPVRHDHRDTAHASGLDVVAAVAELKQRRELQIHGSTTLGPSLLDAGLVDELRLVVAPVIVGDGRRLLERSEHATALRLVDTTTTPLGLAVHTYLVDGPARFDVYNPAVHTFAEQP